MPAVRRTAARGREAVHHIDGQAGAPASFAVVSVLDITPTDLDTLGFRCDVGLACLDVVFETVWFQPAAVTF